MVEELPVYNALSLTRKKPTPKPGEILQFYQQRNNCPENGGKILRH